MFSDSQASSVPTDQEAHGLHKQYAGKDFILGGAGNSLVVMLALKHISQQQALDATSVATEVRRYLDEAFEPEVRKQACFILATAGATHVLFPGVRSFVERGPVTSIGSGEAFVNRAIQRNQQLGIDPPLASLADAVLLAEAYADASNESLTVDDRHAVSFISTGRTYVLGDARVVPAFAPPPVQAAWPEASSRWQEISAIAGSVRGETRAAQRVFSVLSTGTAPDQAALAMAALAIAGQRVDLQVKLNEYIVWYDALLGR